MPSAPTDRVGRGRHRLSARHSGKYGNAVGPATADSALLEQRTYGPAIGFQWSCA